MQQVTRRGRLGQHFALGALARLASRLLIGDPRGDLAAEAEGGLR